MNRKKEIARVLGKYGLDWLAESETPWSVLARPRQWFGAPEPRSQPERVRLALEELGTTYIKLGQAISTRTDLVPPEYVAELAKLQDRAPEVPYAEIESIIESELGASTDVLFDDFECKPIAAASVAQVHRAALADGTRVVVKVQRPGTRERVEEDLVVLGDMVDLMGRTSFGQRYNLFEWLQEFAFTLRNELDFRREGRNADRFRENFLGDSSVVVPRVFWPQTSQRVLTMEEARGFKINDHEAIDRYDVNRPLLSENCARIIFTQIFEHGFFQADPHPGNLFVTPSGAICLLDLGMVGHLDKRTRESITRVLISLGTEDIDGLVDELLVTGTPRKMVDRRALRAHTARLVELHLNGPPDQFSLAQMLNDIFRSAADHDVRIPSDLLFLARSIAIAEGVGRELDPHFRLMSYAERYLRERIERERSPQGLAKKAEEWYPDFADLAMHLPTHTRRLLSQLERGELTVRARTEVSEDLLRRIDSAANRVSTSMVIAGMLAGFSVLLFALHPGERQGIASVLVQLLLVIMLVAAAGLLGSMWKSKR